MKKDETTYDQPEKEKVRKLIIKEAVDSLTVNRINSVCVDKSYVRNVRQYFLEDYETLEQKEAERIESIDLVAWENLFSSVNKVKYPQDLKVCYLSGPEPSNDFNAFIKMGVLPQNILAFEKDNESYNIALNESAYDNFLKPKIVKYGIENYFRDIPKKFDIVYLDACGSVPSKKHALRCFASLCKYHRLESPGVVITNFSSPFGYNQSSYEGMEYDIEMMALYLFCKDREQDQLYFERDKKRLNSQRLESLRKMVVNNFDRFYGDFLTSVIMDISSIVIPYLRFANSNFLGNIIDGKIPKNKSKIKVQDLNNKYKNSIFKFFNICKYYDTNKGIDPGIRNKLNLLISELTGLGGEYTIDLYSTSTLIQSIKNRDINLKVNIVKQLEYFNGESIHQFLDKPNSNLYIDCILNQVGYPLHPVVNKIKRYKYKAKSTAMFTDLIVLDECRYIYDWLPTINQIDQAFENRSLQYVFRFALDGLIKNRLNYNNEFFYSGSVISDGEKGFNSKQLEIREDI
ncbi:hypothetical protein [Tissierella praeacuta]|uniref:hypothetical protein n=1 Tax=Tissierella praeacuta TaxID=43131 RepID=UPI00289F163B|nr:hypothetical protein [Tissierella praeacuta]